MISFLREIFLIMRLTFAKHPRLRNASQVGFVTILLIIGTVGLSAWMSLPAYQDFFGYHISEDWAMGFSIGFAFVISGMMSYPTRTIVAWVRSKQISHPVLTDILNNVSPVLMTITVLSLSALLWFDITKNTMGRDIRSYDLGADFIAANADDGTGTNTRVEQLIAQQQRLEAQKDQIMRRYTYRDGRVVFLPKPHTSNTEDMWKADKSRVESIDDQLETMAGLIIDANNLLNKGNGRVYQAGEGISDKAKSLMGMGVWLVYIIMALATLGLQAVVMEVYTTDNNSTKLYQAGAFDDSITAFFKNILSNGFWTKHTKGGGNKKGSGGPLFTTPKATPPSHPGHSGPSGPGLGGPPPSRPPHTPGPPSSGGSQKHLPRTAAPSTPSDTMSNNQLRKIVAGIVDSLYATNNNKPVPKKAVIEELNDNGIPYAQATVYRWLAQQHSKKVQ